MVQKPPPFKGLNIRILIINPIKGRGFINHGSGLGVSRNMLAGLGGLGGVGGLGAL